MGTKLTPKEIEKEKQKAEALKMLREKEQGKIIRK